MELSNTVPMMATATPMTTHFPMMGHASSGTATLSMTSPMPKMLAMPHATKHATTMVATCLLMVLWNRVSSSTNMHEPSGAKNSALNVAAMPVAATKPVMDSSAFLR